MRTRGSGVLLHITSLPSPYGIGDLGPEAQRFADFLAEAKQSFWQVLPLNPTDPAFGNTPYNSISAFAGNYLIISPDLLMVEGLLLKDDLTHAPSNETGIDYPGVMAYKDRLLDRAFEHFKSRPPDENFRSFCSRNASWLDDYALFKSIKAAQGEKAWSSWPQGLRDRQKESLDKAKDELKERIERERFVQYTFFKQWNSLKERCNSREINIIGDIPIYVNYDSADVWSHQDLFKLDAEKRQVSSAGVPPDYFSTTGQLWGNPIYDWDALQKSGYSWWILRLEHNFSLFDFLRIDHFRGLVAYWEVPAGEKTAIRGSWVEAPHEDFFATIFRRFISAPIIAEDLGTITADVREVIERFEIPGMIVLQFAFGGETAKNPYIPHNHRKNRIVYTGTHDNNTTRGWFEKDASQEEKESLFKYMGRELSADQVSWEMARLCMASIADISVIPVQDLLGLGPDARMNFPGKTTGNYQWRLKSGQASSELAMKVAEMAKTYGRT